MMTDLPDVEGIWLMSMHLCRGTLFSDGRGSMGRQEKAFAERERGNWE
jgi:hypothetical protein